MAAVFLTALSLMAAGTDGRTQAEKDAAQKEADELFKELFDSTPGVQGKREPSAFLDRHGAINTMRIPGAWVSWRQDIGIFHKLGLHPRGRKDIHLYSYFVWRAEHEKRAAHLLRVLQSPVHSLTQDELNSLRPVLEPLIGWPSNEFDIRSASTQDLNRRRVVVVEGHWTKHRARANMILVDASGCGKLPQLVAFTAPTNEYSRLLPDALAGFKSIHWRSAIQDFCRDK